MEKHTIWNFGRQFAREPILRPMADGSLIWRAWIAEPQEMLPWIRGWGADVVVLAPEEVRTHLAGEARRLAQTYGWEVHRTVDGPGDDKHRFFDDFFGG